jgi:hypothetical protein
MRLLGLDDRDREEVLAARPDSSRHSGLLRQLEERYSELVRRMGTTGPLAPWPALVEHGAVGRFGYVWVFLSAVPEVRRYHVGRGIADSISWAALGVLAVQMANRRAIYGTGGLHTQDWMTHHFRGAVYPLGRLHFERLVIPRGAERVGDGGPEPGDHVLGLHIPEGRLTPESVDDALARAQGFFGTHFADEPCRYAVCTSWILDPQLAGYLPPDSNIIQFQRRFTLRPAGPPDNATVVEFLFKRPIADLDRLPRETTLQRAVIDHITAGHHWHPHPAWLPL